MMPLQIILPWIISKYTSIGLGPAVYFEIIQGRMICSGIMGIASMASLSLGTPASTNLSPEAASAAAKPTLDVRSIAMVVGITLSLMISNNSLYVCTTPRSGSSQAAAASSPPTSDLNTATSVVAITNITAQNWRKPGNVTRP